MERTAHSAVRFGKCPRDAQRLTGCRRQGTPGRSMVGDRREAEKWALHLF